MSQNTYIYHDMTYVGGSFNAFHVGETSSRLTAFHLRACSNSGDQFNGVRTKLTALRPFYLLYYKLCTNRWRSSAVKTLVGAPLSPQYHIFFSSSLTTRIEQHSIHISTGRIKRFLSLHWLLLIGGESVKWKYTGFARKESIPLVVSCANDVSKWERRTQNVAKA